MPPAENPTPGRLTLYTEAGRIVDARGDRSIVPSGVENLEDVGVLDLVHPVDREAIAQWLGGGPGSSPPFRRPELDDPLRWFRLLAAETGDESRRTLLLEEVTEETRREAMHHRIMEILARVQGEALLKRIPSLAVELVGGVGGYLLDLHGPLAVVRAVSGHAGLGVGSALMIAGTPLEQHPGGDADIVVYEGGMEERFPDDVLVRDARAGSGVVVFIRIEEEGEPVAVVLVLVRGRRRFAAWERGLLRTLGLRAAAELEAQEERARLEGGESPADMGAAMRLLGAQGAVNAFANLLAAIGLNAELALGEADCSEVLRVRLERITDSVSRGRKLVRFVELLSAQGRDVPAPVALERVVAELSDLVPLCAEGLELRKDGSVVEQNVWATEGALVAALATLLLVAADAIPGGVLASVARDEAARTPAGLMVPLLVRISPRTPEMPEDAWRRLSNAVRAVEPIITAMGGMVSEGLETNTFQVELQLLAVEDRGGAGGA